VVVTLIAAADYMMVARLFVLSSQSTSHLPSFEQQLKWLHIFFCKYVESPIILSTLVLSSTQPWNESHDQGHSTHQLNQVITF
jgi:hypothetical protein